MSQFAHQTFFIGSLGVSLFNNRLLIQRCICIGPSQSPKLESPISISPFHILPVIGSHHRWSVLAFMPKRLILRLAQQSQHLLNQGLKSVCLIRAAFRNWLIVWIFWTSYSHGLTPVQIFNHLWSVHSHWGVRPFRQALPWGVGFWLPALSWS